MGERGEYSPEEIAEMEKSRIDDPKEAQSLANKRKEAEYVAYDAKEIVENNLFEKNVGEIIDTISKQTKAWGKKYSFTDSLLSRNPPKIREEIAIEKSELIINLGKRYSKEELEEARKRIRDHTYWILGDALAVVDTMFPKPDYKDSAIQPTLDLIDKAISQAQSRPIDSEKPQPEKRRRSPSGYVTIETNPELKNR